MTIRTSRIPPEQWPICAICKKQIDEFLQWDDHDAERRWFGVKCHGAFEKTYLDRKELEQFRVGNLHFGEAFANKRLEPPLAALPNVK